MFVNELDEFFSRTDERTKTLCKQVSIERFLERFVDAAAIETHWLPIIWKQSNQNDVGEVDILSKVLADLHRFDLPNREVNDDAVWIETFCLNTSFETASCNSNLERFLRWQFSLEILNQHLVLSDD